MPPLLPSHLAPTPACVPGHFHPPSQKGQSDNVVSRTHKALIDSDQITGRKLINQYEVIEEIGRGMHGKVKLARNLETGDHVAIKIIPRFSKKRRLGKLTALSPQDKTKKEIAILKKIRHPNVVALLEVIDDPELKKIYMILEHVELGEIVWRKKGLPHICLYERRRVDREMRGEAPSAEEEKYNQILERRQAIKELKRAKMAQNYPGASDYWSVEHGAADEGSSSSAGHQSRVQSREDFAIMDDAPRSSSRPSSQVPSRTHSRVSVAEGAPTELDEAVRWDEDDIQTPGPFRPASDASAALEGTMYGAYQEDNFRGRSPSMADSIISHMSSVDFNEHPHDAFTDDFSYVPCFSTQQARSTFRDTVLGLEYLHYQGVVHRDIKPANLLWTRDHRVRISDFGVSYFGRPIRDGEPDDTVSESEARDFDDDLELAKTVGTPAFFAPEICYTDLDQEQPKVSEQIDVWSLGVTLYCLIYARIPFLAEDEFQMFRKIATEEVYIPRRRLKPVSPSTSPSAISLYKRQNSYPYRDDNDLAYEDVDNLLMDLIRQMLIKNPEKRIRLRDIKRHPWVVADIQNPVGWLDDTDPARPSSGRRIQVDEGDLSAAVVPLTLLERARSVVKKAVGKVMQPLVERSDSKSRLRATSSAASSAGDSLFNNVPPATPQYRTDRRRSLRPDDYFAAAISESSVGEHQLTADGTPYDPLATVLAISEPSREHSRSGSIDGNRDEFQQPVTRGFHRHGFSAGKLSQRLSHIGSHVAPSGPQTTPSSPYFDGSAEDLHDDTEGSRARAMESISDDGVRSLSVDRFLFESTDKRAQAHVGVSTATAPGSIPVQSRRPRSMRSIDLSKHRHSPSLASPRLSSSTKPYHSTYQNGQPQSDSNLDGRRVSHHVDDRPTTAHRVEHFPDAKSPPARVYNTSNAESFARAKDILFRRQQLDLELESAKAKQHELDPVDVPCPPSPDDENFAAREGKLTRGNTMTTVKSSSTDSMAGVVGTPLTSPSEATSPVASFSGHKVQPDRMHVFQSDPSLPALLSGASSVSADLEGELLGKPGVVGNHTALLETTESLTPPALSKEPDNGFPMDQVFENPSAMQSGHLTVNTALEQSSTSHSSPEAHDDEDDEDGSDDDGIFLMAKSKKMSPGTTQRRSPPFEARRRDTNASTASDETAKRVVVHDEAPAAPESS